MSKDIDYRKIVWEQTSLLSKDIDEREEVWCVIGSDPEGKTYTGIATYSCEELVKVEDVEEAE